MPRRRPMTPDERREVAFHEIGHVAMVYWRRDLLHSRRVEIYPDRRHPEGIGGQFVVGGIEWSAEEVKGLKGAHAERILAQIELDLMVTLGGWLAQMLSIGSVPTRAIRVEADSDSARIRRLVRILKGKDDRKYQFDVQERCRAILQEPRMWAGITTAAELLAEREVLDGEDIERILEEAGAPTKFPRRLV